MSTQLEVGRVATVRAIEASGVVAVIRLKDAVVLRAVANALIDGGVRALEITMTVPSAVAAGRFDVITSNARQFVQAVQSARTSVGGGR